MENSYHQTTRRNFLNQLGLAAAGMTTVNTALATTQYDSGIPRNSVPDRTSDNSAKRVIMISLDGICVEGFQKVHAPSLKGMMSQGAFSLDTRVVMPSVTLPNWTSHLTGSGPEQHGVFNNNWTPANSSYPAVRRDEDGYYPSVFQALKNASLPAKQLFTIIGNLLPIRSTKNTWMKSSTWQTTPMLPITIRLSNSSRNTATTRLWFFSIPFIQIMRGTNTAGCPENTFNLLKRRISKLESFSEIEAGRLIQRYAFSISDGSWGNRKGPRGDERSGNDSSMGDFRSGH